MKKILLTLAIMANTTLFLLGQSTVYVSPTGTGNGATEATATSLGTAMDNSNIPAGTTIVLLDGTYELTGDRYFWVKSGTASAPITIKAKNKHMAILKGNNEYSSSRYAVLYIAGCKHVVIDGLTVMHSSGSLDQQSGINVATAVGGGANGANVNSEYVTVKNCKVYGHGGGGVVSSASDHITFEGNIVYGNSTRSALNTSGISIYKPKALTSDSNYWGMIIRNNICYDNKCELDFYYNEGGTIYQSDNPTDGNGIILDLFDNDGGNPKYGKRVLVENNVCFNNGGAGIKSYKSSLARLVNNTCYKNNQVLNKYGTSAQIVFYDTGGVNGVYNEGIYNNVCVADPNLTTNEDYSMIVDLDMSKVYNNFLIGKGAKNTNYNYDPAGFATSNTIKLETDQDAARFQNAAAGNFNLKNDSPLIGAYTETYGPTNDVIGTTRPQGTYTDLGAYEYVYVSSVALSPSSASVAAGSNTTLTATVSPSNASYKNVSWSSSNTAVATVNSSGVVSGVAAGTATIKVTTTDGSKTASTAITVTGATATTYAVCGLIENVGFESNDLTKWTQSTSGVASTTTNKRSGNYAAQVTGAGGINYGTLINVQAGRRVKLTFYAKIAGSPSSPQVGIDYINSAGTEIGEITQAISGTNYAQYTIEVVPKAGTTKVQIWSYKGGSGTLFLDDFCLTQSNDCGLVTNYGFEDGLTGFTNTNSVASTSTSYRSGNLAAVINGSGGFNRTNNIAVTPGHKINFEAYAYVSGSPTNAQIGIDYLDANGAKKGNKFFAISATSYTKVSSSEVPPAGTTQVLIWTYKGSTGGKLFMDDFCLTTQSAAREGIVFEEKASLAYPNPISSVLNVKSFAGNESKTIKIQLVNMLGRVIFEDSATINEAKNEVSFNVSKVTGGIYFMKAQQGTKSQIQKIIK